MEINLLDLLSFEMNDELRGIFDLGKKDIYSLIEPETSLTYEKAYPLEKVPNPLQNKFSDLTLMNQTIYSYFINDHLFGLEFLNWRTRTSYIKEDETILNFYKNPNVMDMGLSEILDFFEKHNINVSLTESWDDPNYLRINCDKYKDWSNWDQLIIFHKGYNRIDYFLANKNSVRVTRNLNK